MSAERFKYRAFISYSHSDTAVATWLHKALESYSIPKRLVGRETSTGVIGKKVGTIFRDRDELPVAADLSGQINEALAATQFLIVLCSTKSAQSKWVNQEIINFKRMKGAASIIAVIVDGEPYAASKPGNEAKECFPPALKFHVTPDGVLTDQPAEPIAADLRPDKDPKRLVRMKVLAGLLGVGLDELIRRDNARRQKLTTYALAASVALMGVMGALTFNAIEARNEAEIAQERAERQKTQAEGLIEFMLGDLKEKLEPVGRLDVLDSVGTKAMSYFSALRTEEVDADTLDRRARALHVIGQIDIARGNLDKAQDSLEEALKTTKALIEREPDNNNRLYTHIQSLSNIGDIYSLRGESANAESAYMEFMTGAKRLSAANPNNTEWQAQQGHAAINIGIVLLQSDRIADSIEYFDQAIRVFDNLAAREPVVTKWVKEKAKALGWIATSLFNKGDMAASYTSREQQAQLLERILAIDPKNKELTRNLFVARRSLGNIDAQHGKFEKALALQLSALQLAKQITDLDPQNSEWLDLKTRVLLDIAETHMETSNLIESKRTLGLAEQLALQLTVHEPKMIQWRVQLLGRAKVCRLKALLANRQIAQVEEEATSAIRFFEEIASSGSFEQEIRLRLGRTLFIRGAARQSKGKQDGAKADLTQAIAIVNSQAANGNQEALIIVALAASRLGLDSIALDAATKLKEGGYKRRDLMELKV